MYDTFCLALFVDKKINAMKGIDLPWLLHAVKGLIFFFFFFLVFLCLCVWNFDLLQDDSPWWNVFPRGAYLAGKSFSFRSQLESHLSSVHIALERYVHLSVHAFQHPFHYLDYQNKLTWSVALITPNFEPLTCRSFHLSCYCSIFFNTIERVYSATYLDSN